jgi:formate dehydrogenase major subunit
MTPSISATYSDTVRRIVADLKGRPGPLLEVLHANYEKLDRMGGIQWPCYDAAPERSTSRFPLILTTGRILSQYNVGAQTRRTQNTVWHPEDILDIHPHDAEVRGISDGDWVGLTSRAGETVLRARVTEKIAPGVVYTTFHFPETNANVVTTENSDWATNCPEYKVTAVEVVFVNQKDAWQKRAQEERSIPKQQRRRKRATAPV